MSDLARVRLLSFLALAVLLVAGGCAPSVPHIALDKGARPEIRKIALLEVSEPQQYVVVNMGGGAMAFGLIGGLAQAGANQSNTTEFTKRMNDRKLTLGAAMVAALREELSKYGYDVAYLSGVRPGMKTDRKEVDYGNVETDADAILDVWFVAAGYLSTPSSLDYLPWVRVIARLVSSQTRQPIYFQMLNYGALLKSDGIVDLPANPAYKYGSAGTLLERADQAADGLRGSIQPIAVRIVEDLR